MYFQSNVPLAGRFTERAITGLVAHVLTIQSDTQSIAFRSKERVVTIHKMLPSHLLVAAFSLLVALVTSVAIDMPLEVDVAKRQCDLPYATCGPIGSPGCCVATWSCVCPTDTGKDTQLIDLLTTPVPTANILPRIRFLNPSSLYSGQDLARLQDSALQGYSLLKHQPIKAIQKGNGVNPDLAKLEGRICISNCGGNLRLCDQGRHSYNHNKGYSGRQTFEAKPQW